MENRHGFSVKPARVKLRIQTLNNQFLDFKLGSFVDPKLAELGESYIP